MLPPPRRRPPLPAFLRLRYTRRAARLSDDDSARPRRGRWKRGDDVRPAEETLYAHKSRGQHFITNPRVLDVKAGVRPSDTVLEIGPVTGNLNLRLLHRSANDALKTKFPEFDVCVANIPYCISSPLVVKLLYGGFAFRGATLLLQEFAGRLLGKPGDSEYNGLAVNVNLAATVKHVMVVTKRDFVPCPKVDSLVVNIEPRREVLDVDLEEWRAFVRACFSKKNKTLGAIFKQKSRVLDLLKMATSEPTGRNEEDYDDRDTEDAHEVQKEEGDEAAEMCVLKDNLVATLREDGFKGKRPSKMSIEELLHLLALFNKAGIHFHHQL